MATLGQQLRAAREAKGISAKDAGAATNILTKMILAMEADDFSGMAAPTYAKGFIRLYAGHLGINPDPLIEEYTARHATVLKPLIDEESQLEQNRRNLPVSAILLKWLGAPVKFVYSILTRAKKKTSGESGVPAAKSSKNHRVNDIRTLAVGAAVLLVLILLIVSASNCMRRHAAEKSAQLPAEAPARMLLDKPLPDLYLVEPGKIESSR